MKTMKTKTPKTILRWIQYTLFVLGGVALAYCAFVLAEQWLFQRQQNRAFERALQQEHSAVAHFPPPQSQAVPNAQPAPPAAKPTGHSVIGRLEVPSLRLSVMVLADDSDGSLRLGAGHIPGTALPGQAGNVGIAGHRDTVFRPLRHISRNDEITLTTLQGTYVYQVQSVKVVSPDDVQVLAPSPQPSLTLVTCYPFYYVGPAPRRFVVRARLVTA
jgi:sortase A